MTLPPGQRLRDDFPRFGMPRGASYRGAHPDTIALKGELSVPATLTMRDIATLPRVEVVCDFHCVATWSVANKVWSGWRFGDFVEEFVRPLSPHDGARTVVFKGADGFWASLPWDDAVDAGVLLADRLDGDALSFDHGAPLRLLAPGHYGYKSVKHLESVAFYQGFLPGPGLNEHPRARVAFEERGRHLPGPVLRFAYRPWIGKTVRRLATTGRPE